MKTRYWILVTAAALLIGSFTNDLVATAQILPTSNLMQVVPKSKVIQVPTSRIVGVSRTDAIETTSTSFVDIPGLGRSFKVPTGKVATVSIAFSGEVNVGGNSDNAIFTQALVDNAPAKPGAHLLEWYSPNSGARSHGFNYYSKNLPAGVHTIKMQWSSLNGGKAYMLHRSMVLTIIYK